MQKNLRSEGSWIPASVPSSALHPHDMSDFGSSLFQLILQKIDNRAAAKHGDLVAALAFLTGRIVQRAAFRETPERFRPDISGNGVPILRNDEVSAKLAALRPGSLASTLMESALMAGARRLPDFSKVLSEAQEALRRRGAVDLRDADLSAAPQQLAAEVQGDVDGLLFDPSDRAVLVRAGIQACGHAVGYQRTRFCPAHAAELCLSVALYGGWLDQREIQRG